MPELITGIISLISNIVGGISEDQKQKIALALQENQNITDLMKAQADIDAQEASSNNLIKDWRDVVGWVGALAFAWQFLGFPISIVLAGIFNRPDVISVLNSIHLDYTSLNNILMGMLGLGAMQAWERTRPGK